MAQSHLGKVFISYSSEDGEFVSKLNRRVRRSGHDTWLDKHELLAGDVLSSKIAEGIHEAQVVLIVVSASSADSAWVKYELSLATPRMVKGDCRVIALLVDDVELPAEVSNLVYADFRQSFEEGFARLRRALREENERAALTAAFWVVAGDLIHSTFGWKGHVSLDGDYTERTYDIVQVGADDAGRSRHAVVEVIDGSEKPLSEAWWKQFRTSMAELPERLFLVVTDRCVEFESDHSACALQGLSVRELSLDSEAYAVIVDCSNTPRVEWPSMLEAARRLLLQFDERVARLKSRFGSFEWSSALTLLTKKKRRRPAIR